MDRLIAFLVADGDRNKALSTFDDSVVEEILIIPYDHDPYNLVFALSEEIINGEFENLSTELGEVRDYELAEDGSVIRLILEDDSFSQYNVDKLAETEADEKDLDDDGFEEEDFDDEDFQEETKPTQNKVVASLKRETKPTRFNSKTIKETDLDLDYDFSFKLKGTQDLLQRYLLREEDFANDFNLLNGEQLNKLIKDPMKELGSLEGGSDSEVLMMMAKNNIDTNKTILNEELVKFDEAKFDKEVSEVYNQVKSTEEHGDYQRLKSNLSTAIDNSNLELLEISKVWENELNLFLNQRIKALIDEFVRSNPNYTEAQLQEKLKEVKPKLEELSVEINNKQAILNDKLSQGMDELDKEDKLSKPSSSAVKIKKIVDDTKTMLKKLFKTQKEKEEVKPVVEVKTDPKLEEKINKLQSQVERLLDEKVKSSSNQTLEEKLDDLMRRVEDQISEREESSSEELEEYRNALTDKELEFDSLNNENMELKERVAALELEIDEMVKNQVEQLTQAQEEEYLDDEEEFEEYSDDEEDFEEYSDDEDSEEDFEEFVEEEFEDDFDDEDGDDNFLDFIENNDYDSDEMVEVEIEGSDSDDEMLANLSDEAKKDLEEENKKAKRKTGFIRFGIILLVAAVIAVAAWFFTRDKNQGEVDNPQTQSENNPSTPSDPQEGSDETADPNAVTEMYGLKVGDVLQVGVQGEIKPVTITAFTNDGAISRDANGGEVRIPSSLLEEFGRREGLDKPETDQPQTPENGEETQTPPAGENTQTEQNQSQEEAQTE